MSDPVTREEKFLAAAAGDAVNLPSPITREELFLAKAAGMDITAPEPITRKERFLNRISGGGGTGGTTEPFVGIKYSDFNEIGLPRIADATSLPADAYGGYPYLFANNQATENGGWNTSLTDIYLPDGLTYISGNMFYNCGSLKRIHGDFSAVEIIRDGAFRVCRGLEEAPVFQNAKTVEGYAFDQCRDLRMIDFPSVTSFVGGLCLGRCSYLTAVILRSETLCSIENTSILIDSFHYHGTVNATYNPDGLFDGYVYVPSALIEDYKVATNWSIILADTHPDLFRALEDYTVDGTITGALDPEKVGGTV